MGRSVVEVVEGPLAAARRIIWSSAGRRREQQCGSQVPASVASEMKKSGARTEVLEDKPPALLEGWSSVNGNTTGCQGPKGIFVFRWWVAVSIADLAELS